MNIFLLLSFSVVMFITIPGVRPYWASVLSVIFGYALGAFMMWLGRKSKEAS